MLAKVSPFCSRSRPTDEHDDINAWQELAHGTLLGDADNIAAIERVFAKSIEQDRLRFVQIGLRPRMASDVRR